MWLIFILECCASGCGTQNPLFPSRGFYYTIITKYTNILAKTYVYSNLHVIERTFQNSKQNVNFVVLELKCKTLYLIKIHINNFVWFLSNLRHYFVLCQNGVYHLFGTYLLLFFKLQFISKMKQNVFAQKSLGLKTLAYRHH